MCAHAFSSYRLSHSSDHCPCSHAFCAPCLGHWIADQNRYRLPGGTGSFTWDKPSMQGLSAPCSECLLSWRWEAQKPAVISRAQEPQHATPKKHQPTPFIPQPFLTPRAVFCRTKVTVSDIYVFGASSAARELAITPLDDFMRGKAAAAVVPAEPVGAGAGAGAANAAADAAAAAPAPGSDVAGAGGSPPREPLPGQVAPTEAVNSVKLSVPGGASAAGERYGAKIATLLRRLKRMPAGDKAVVATSWPRLRPVIAAALRAEGIDAVVLEGTPAQMSASVAQFTAKGDPHRIKVMLLAVGTDCSGLTLTVANHLFIVVRGGESGDVEGGGCAGVREKRHPSVTC